MTKRNAIRPVLYLAVPLLLALFCLAAGRYPIPVSKVFSILLQGDNSEPMMRSTIISIRLPRIILAILVGGGLSVSGLAFQSLFSNPLATPDTLGVASGASLGAILSLIWGLSFASMQVISLLFGLFAIAVTYLVSRKDGKRNMVDIILSGIIVGSLFNSFVSLSKFLANPETQLPAITYWLMGSLSSANWTSLSIGAGPIIFGCVLLYLIRWRLNILPLSDDEAQASGTNVRLLRTLTLFSATLITASAVSMSGQVGWVGLLVPHIARMMLGEDKAKLVPATLSFGACFLLIVDTLARSVTASELPISILTSSIGAPFFISLIRKRGGRSL